MDLCRCGHQRVTHEHYRAGTDCSQCACPRYASRRPVHARWQRFLRTLTRGGDA